MILSTKSEKLRAVLLAIFLGIFLASWQWSSELKIQNLQTYFLLGSGIILALSILWRNFWISLLAILILANGYGQWRNSSDLKHDVLPAMIGETHEFWGHVDSFPDIREKNTRAFISISAIGGKQNGATDKELGKLLLVVPSGKDFDYGDEIHFSGKVEYPTAFGGFDYAKYLRTSGAQTLVKNPKIFEVVAQKTSGNFFIRLAKSARNFLAKNLEKSLPEPHSKIGMGILLGVKNQLPTFTANDFKNSGLQHLLVVSGTNVTIVIVFISLIFKRFGRRATFWGGILAIAFFVAMTGGEAPVVRAAIMGASVALAAMLGRFSDAKNLVLLSAALIAIISPRTVQSDIGFFLSFGATIGIILLTPVLNQWLGKLKVPEELELRNLLSVSLAAQIAVLPVLGIYFGTFPISGIVANLVAEPIVPLAMLFSFISTITGALPIFVAKIFGIPAFMLIEFLLQIAKFFGQFTPLPLSKNFCIAWGIVVGGFFLWALFSRTFAQNYLEKFDKKLSMTLESSEK